jgi:hypothetical protein
LLRTCGTTDWCEQLLLSRAANRTVPNRLTLLWLPIGLFHTASPFFVGGPNTSSANAGGEDYNEQNLLTPAIDGTLNVLRSAVAAGESMLCYI